MKKYFLFGILFGIISLNIIVPVYAAWEKIKEEPEGTYYIDNTAYKCNCASSTVYFKIKQVPTHSNAKYIINNLKLSFSGSDKYWIFNYATRYYNSGKVEDVKLPPVHAGKIFNSGSGLDIAVQKACNHCDAYCDAK